MDKCKCISSTHGHASGRCLNKATKENKRYCEYCANRAAKEFEQTLNKDAQSHPDSQSPKSLPKELLDKYSEIEKSFVLALQIGDPSFIDRAFDYLKDEYTKILKLQPEGIRYHKGGYVHNMGICKYYTLEIVESFKFFLLGYIEDLLSDKNKASNAPGATNLKNIFYVIDKEFSSVQECVKQIIKEKGVVQNPQDVLDRFSDLKMYEELIKKVKKISLLIRPDKYPSISQLPNIWDKRVFIGGDYEAISSLDLIIRQVIEFGYQPIIAKEFKSSEKQVHHDALLLLHNCKYAIFDVSGKGGHLMEAERTLDYGTETLFVCHINEAPRVSAMLASLGDKYKIRYFNNRKDLVKHIFDFLKPKDIKEVTS